MFVALTRCRARRQRRFEVLSALIVIASTIAIAPAPAHAADSTVDVTAWVPYWKAQEALPSFQSQSGIFNELTPFFFSAVSATDIVFNPNMASPSTRLEEYRAAAQAKGKPFIATIVDAMPARQMAGVLATPESRTAHVQALLAFMVGNGFDGIDLDYEQFAFSDGRATWPDRDGASGTFNNWGAFLVELAASVHAVPGKILATSVPPIYNSEHNADSGYWVYNFPVMASV